MDSSTINKIMSSVETIQTLMYFLTIGFAILLIYYIYKLFACQYRLLTGVCSCVASCFRCCCGHGTAMSSSDSEEESDLLNATL